MLKIMRGIFISIIDIDSNVNKDGYTMLWYEI